MSALILMAAAVLWGLSERRGGGLDRIAIAAHGAGALAVLVARGDLPPAGWVASAVVAGWLPGLLALRPGFAPALRVPMAVIAAFGAAVALAPSGPGVRFWTAWAIPHIVAGAAAVALRRLRGQATPLLLLAAILTAVPLAGPRASAVHVYHDGAAAYVTGQVGLGRREGGAVRTLPARVALPGERPVRLAALLVLAAAAALGFVRRRAGLRAMRAARLAAVAAVAIHALMLVTAMVPRDLGVEADDLVSVAQATLQLEAEGAENATRIKPPAGPYRGGPGAPAIPLALALLAAGLALAAAAPAPGDDPESAGAARTEAILEGRLAMAATVLLAIAAATGMVWSNLVWGGPAVGDPKIFALVAALLIYGAYFSVQGALPRLGRVPSWLAVLALGVLLLSMLGAELGWTAPSLHDFGA